MKEVSPLPARPDRRRARSCVRPLLALHGTRVRDDVEALSKRLIMIRDFRAGELHANPVELIKDEAHATW